VRERKKERKGRKKRERERKMETGDRDIAHVFLR
jgi:hypothetical protein